MKAKKDKDKVYKCRMIRTVINEGNFYKIGQEYELTQEEYEKLKGFCVVLQRIENANRQGENIELETS